MPSTLTMFGRRFLMRALLTPDTYVPITEVEIALTRSIPVANAAASQLLEPTALSYARQTYPTGSIYWAPTNFGELYNTTLITFDQIQAEEWGWIRGYAIIDPTSQQCLDVGSLKVPFRGVIGMVPKLEPGSVMLGIYD